MVATPAQLPPAPPVASKATIVLGDGVIACNDTHIRVPPSLVITAASERAVVATSPGGVIWVARTGDGLAADLLQTWTALHVQLEGPLAFGASWEPVTDLMKAAAEYECWSNPRAHC